MGEAINKAIATNIKNSFDSKVNNEPTLAPSTLRMPISFDTLLGRKHGKTQKTQAGDKNSKECEGFENLAYYQLVII